VRSKDKGGVGKTDGNHDITPRKIKKTPQVIPAALEKQRMGFNKLKTTPGYRRNTIR
jgi:hypothetical protein